MTTLNLTVSICILILVFIADVSSRGYGRRSQGRQSACDTADPIPIRNIDVRELKGTWINLFIRSGGIPYRDITNNFQITFDRVLSNGSALGETRGRWPGTCECLYEKVFWKFTGEQNTYTQVVVDVPRPDGGNGNEWTFLDLMDNRYLLALNCFELDQNRRCTRYIVDLFSRSEKDVPSLATLKRFNQSARQTLCLDVFEDLDPWIYNNKCPAGRFW